MTHFRFLRWTAIFLVAFGLNLQSWAQGRDSKSMINESAVGWELGAHVGNVLPNQIEGASEIFPQWGVRGGWNIGDGTFAEVGATAGRGEGVDWTGVETSIRSGMPIENMLAIVYFGLDLNYYSGVDVSKQMYLGGHVGGGFMTPISPGTWFRADMKFNVSPGTSLHIMGGFMFRIPGSGGGSGS